MLCSNSFFSKVPLFRSFICLYSSLLSKYYMKNSINNSWVQIVHHSGCCDETNLRLLCSTQPRVWIIHYLMPILVVTKQPFQRAAWQGISVCVHSGPGQCGAHIFIPSTPEGHPEVHSKIDLVVQFSFAQLQWGVMCLHIWGFFSLVCLKVVTKHDCSERKTLVLWPL